MERDYGAVRRCELPRNADEESQERGEPAHPREHPEEIVDVACTVGVAERLGVRPHDGEALEEVERAGHEEGDAQYEQGAGGVDLIKNRTQATE